MGAIMDLTIDAMKTKGEAKLKSILAALWHLSANSDDTKAEICAVDGALAFLVDLLDYEAPSKSVIVAENASGVLKNVSSHVATREEYRAVLREKDCMSILLRHLKSQSMVLVNNVCGTLHNLSKHCIKDQQLLWDLICVSQSIPILQSLAHSKHKMISTNAGVILRNLLSAKYTSSNFNVGLSVNFTGVIKTPFPMLQKQNINVNVNCSHIEKDKERTICSKVNYSNEIAYSSNQKLIASNVQLVDNYKSLNGQLEKKYLYPVSSNSDKTEPGENIKSHLKSPSSLQEENYDSAKAIDLSRTSVVPWNSPSESTESFIHRRPCSPADEVSSLNELLVNNADDSSTCVINKTSPTFVKPRYQNFMPNDASHHSPVYNVTRNKDNSSFDEDVNDQPVDYSKKYIERNAIISSNILDNVRPQRPTKKDYSVHRSKVNLFGDYAETDLDEPTDYSLRYAEDDTDEDEKSDREYFPESIQDDTIQTYCTEGTPNQTPLTFSTATSMSDLRVEDSKENDTSKKISKRLNEKKQKETVSVHIKQSTNCERNVPMTLKDSKDLREISSMNSGIMSPEKPVNYCEEGTPGYFSRVSSFSSLNSAMVSLNISDSDVQSNKMIVSNKVVDEKTDESKTEETFAQPESDNVACAQEDKPSGLNIDKVVTFNGEDHCADQTPLMFSRCSSLSSLSGFEQHSIPEDRSSVSDFSRRTSGIISPSELPDSPTQTVPPSPRHHKTPPGEFSRKVSEDPKPVVRQQLFGKSLLTMRSIFEDELATFEEESTPIEFSAATSLSSLTIDDEPRLLDDSNKSEKGVSLFVEEDNTTKNSAKICSSIDLIKEHEQLSDGDEDDEDILAACINMGMQNNRYRQSSKKPIHQKPIQISLMTNLGRYQPCQSPKCSDMTTSPVQVKQSSTIQTTKPVDVVAPDTMHIYCTEDTPAYISPVGSHSNLSALSLASIPDYDEENAEPSKILEGRVHKIDLSDESSNLSGEEEKILDKCIQSGMTKERQKTQSTSIPVERKKSEDKIKLCTPSTSPVESDNNAAVTFGHPFTTPQAETDSEIFDDSPNRSEDEAILAECIKSAMPKARLNVPLPKLPDTSSRRSNLCACSNSLPVRRKFLQSTSQLSEKLRLEASEDSLSLSEEEEDRMLAQCIKSGMPKAQNTSSDTSSMKNWKNS